MAYSLIAMQLREARRAAKRGSPLSLVQQPGDYTQSHLPSSELTVSHSEARFTPERREWRDGMWQLAPAPKGKAKPPKKPVPRTYYCKPEHADRVLRNAVIAVVQDGGCANDVTVITGRGRL